MAKGRAGLYLEGWKFALYLAVPIGASWYYSNPENQKAAVDYYQFLKYPANPSIGTREQIKELLKNEEQRKVYRDQMEELNKQAARSSVLEQREEQDGNSESSRWGWLRWIGLGGRKSSKEEAS